MANPKEDGVLEIDDLEAYVLVGRKKGEHLYIVLASSNLTLPEFGSMMGRLQTDWMVRTAAFGVKTARSNGNQSRIIVPNEKMQS